MNLSIGRLLLLAAAALAAGCAAGPETRAQAVERRAEAPRPAYNLAGYPEATREGYIDGCETAKHSEYGRKDAKRMADDPQYAMGWNDGNSICGR